MQFRKFLCAVLLLFVLVTIAQAEPITLNVTSWNFSTSGSVDSTFWRIQATDPSGKTVAIAWTYRIGPETSGTFQANVSGLPYTATTSAIIADTDVFPRNGSVTFAVTGGFPLRGTQSVTVPLGLRGSIVFGGQTLSFSLPPELGTISYNIGGGLLNMIVAGTSGTVTIDQATPIPEPTTLLLFGSGLAAIGLKTRRRKR